MPRRLSLAFTLVAWLFATGSHWDLVQTFAWGKMFASYSQTMSYVDAARLTFSVDGMCGVCEFVQDAKQTADTDGSPAPAESGTQKIQLGLACSAPVVITAPVAEPWSLSDCALPAARPLAPPVPPPRLA
ncbi:hypothetical protein [Actomonas aquatica]|uniref:DUF2946 domain-containing protein n=1 Tax=Actomonas aquatica TaxID=2866162 RepID=A0ABZ1C679_9BACT|nr:hypothetical protein [Opitutus sp. WL0086]WRQ86870.1 hypothetical protein K1X11_018820 [Opitutus sp. WL0086]